CWSASSEIAAPIFPASAMTSRSSSLMSFFMSLLLARASVDGAQLLESLERFTVGCERVVDVAFGILPHVQRPPALGLADLETPALAQVLHRADLHPLDSVCHILVLLFLFVLVGWLWLVVA